MGSPDDGAGSAAPLSASERADLQRRFDERLASADARTADVFAFKPLERPVASVSEAVYFLFGRAP